MKEHVIPTNKIYLLLKLSQLLDANAKQNVEKNLARIIGANFGLFVLMKLHMKVLTVANVKKFLILETIRRDLDIILFSLSSGITKSLGFTIKILKTSSFLSDLTHIANGTFIIDPNDD